MVPVVAAVFAAQHFWVGRPESVPAPARVAAHQGTPAPQSPRPSTGPLSLSGAGAAARIVVDVGGKVRRPGVLRLPAGSRVADALTAAGGVKEGADLTGLNRARVLIDGEQVLVGVPTPPGFSGTGPAAPGAFAPGPGTERLRPQNDGGAGGGLPAGPLSLNAATAEQLDTLPGVGPVLAQHIVDYRTRNGGFRSVDELREVDGIGDRRFADLQTLVQP
ncbi:helix-hairpin-helix domain-containing protein [Streptomyces sp. NPDC004726]